jgi:hypothetical protein
MCLPTRTDPIKTWNDDVAMVKAYGDEMLLELYERHGVPNGGAATVEGTVVDDRPIDHSQESGRRGRGEGARG